MNGQSASFEQKAIVLEPSVSSVEFTQTLTLLLHDGSGNYVVDPSGFPAFITLTNDDPTTISFTVENDASMTLGGTYPIRIEAELNQITGVAIITPEDTLVG